MIPILFIILGIIYAVRIPKLRRLSPEKFPQVPAEAVTKYRQLELTSIYIFLAVTWGLGLFVALLLGLTLLFGIHEDISANDVLVFITIFVVGLIVSAVYGTLAGRVKKAHKISGH
jgi:MFS family permease